MKKCSSKEKIKHAIPQSRNKKKKNSRLIAYLSYYTRAQFKTTCNYPDTGKDPYPSTTSYTSAALPFQKRASTNKWLLFRDTSKNLPMIHFPNEVSSLKFLLNLTAVKACLSKFEELVIFFYLQTLVNQSKQEMA